jgi:intracellular sulfur oxidation DsrE/DsrF family protein
MRNLHLIILIIFLVPLPILADSQVDRLLSTDVEPDGVVFEILEDDDDALGWALPQVARLSARLRERFPDLSIAVVTHGREQFALLSDEADGLLLAIHDDARQLRSEEIDLHVCGVHAGWDGYTPEDFPDYVDVSASGPAQINDYRSLGYEVILLQREGY